MNRITVKQGQSLFDVALQYLGGINGGLEHLAKVNGLEYDQSLTAGMELEYDPAEIENLELIRQYQVVRNNQVVATANTSDLDAEEIRGVGYDIIEDTLEVYA